MHIILDRLLSQKVNCIYFVNFIFILIGRELSLAQQYGAVGILSFPLFWVAGAGSVVFWVIGKTLKHTKFILTIMNNQS